MPAQSQLQVFVWGSQSHADDNKQFYTSFSLNGTQYSLGDAVCLHPETESQPCYVGRVKACFCDLNPDAAEPHCIEIRWFERLTTLESRFKGQPDKEKELVELEETDVNPIGCIASKASVFRARSYDEALKLAKGHDGVWFFSRGLYRQETNTLVPYAELTTGAHGAAGQDSKRGSRRAAAAAPEEDVADSEDTRSSKKVRLDSTRLNNGLEACAVHPGDADMERTAGRRKASNNASFMTSAPPAAFSNAASVPCGRSCVECGATQTPQWREGPHGPKTLCNACGVRYGRQQNRAGKRCGGAGVSRAAAQQLVSHGRGPAPMLSCAAQQAHSLPQLPQAHKTATSAGMAALAPAAAGAGPAGKVMRGTHERGLEMGGCSQASARPVRQAAVLAANRTAEFARTGNFPDMDEARAHAIVTAPGAAMPLVQPQLDGSFQQTSSSRAGACRTGAPPSPGQQHGGSSSARARTAADLAAYHATGGVEVKLEGGEGVQLASSHESSHNSTESAQEVVVGQAEGEEAEDMLQAGVGGYGICARRLRLGQEEDAVMQLGSGDMTSGDVDAEDNSLLLDGSGGMMLGGGEGLGLPDGMVAMAAEGDGLCPSPMHHHLESNPVLGARNSCSALALAGFGAGKGVVHAAAPDLEDVDLRAVAARASLWVPSISKYTGVLSCIGDVRETLPAPMVAGLMALGRAVDRAAGEAAAADAALAAVHQVLVTRQEEAARARGEAIGVIGRLRAMMSDLVDKHPQLALHSGLQSELGCLPGLDELDDGMMEGCTLLQPCGGNVGHMAGGMPHVGLVVDDADDYEVVMGGGSVHHHPDLDDLVGPCSGGRNTSCW